MSYQISTLSRKQLERINEALELLARVEMGQIGEALDKMRNEQGRNHQVSFDDAKEIERIAKAAVGLSSNASWGVVLFNDTDVAYDLHATLRHYLAWENAVRNGVVEGVDSPRKFPDMLAVDYDAPMQYGSEALPIIQKESDQ